MKKNIKKKLKRKPKITPKKGKKVLVIAKKKGKKKITKKIASKNEVKQSIKKTVKSKIKIAPRKSTKDSLKKKRTKKVIKRKRNKDESNGILTFGNIGKGYRKTLVLLLGIVIVSSMIIVQNMMKVEEKIQQQPIPRVAGVESSKNVVREKEINDIVAGYPIERMTKYIAKQDPKVSAFLIAIAKKESAWGERKPVLEGEDCFNYWGFRLKSDRMGSGGHTCFDSPEEAVSIVGSRISHLVNDEKIDTPQKMVIWKCGYDCDGPQAAGSEKWIKDVDYYYKQLIN